MKKLTILKTLLLSILSLAVFSSAAMAVEVGEDFDFEQFKEVIETYFYLDYDEAILESDDLDEIIANLSAIDPYFQLLTVEEREDFTSTYVDATYAIGVYFTYTDASLEVISVTSGYPAEVAGLMAGDVVTEFKGETVADLSQADLEALIVNATDDVIVIVVERDGEQLTFEITPINHTISVSTLSMLTSTLGYIQIYGFTDSTAEELQTLISTYVEKGMTSLIISLEDNSGGLMDACYDSLDLFLGKAFVNAEMGNVEENGIFTTDSDDDFLDLSLLILTNENTGSAAEVFVTALVDNARALTLGQQTAGMGYFKYMFTLSDGSGLFFIGGENVRPSGVSINVTNGFTPDITSTNEDLLVSILDTLIWSEIYTTTVEMSVYSPFITVDGEEYVMPVPVDMQGDATYIPIRAIAEALDCYVTYDNGIVDIYNFQNHITVDIAANTVTSNGITKSTNVYTSNDSMYVPTSFFKEYLGYTVVWDGSDKSITITN